MKGLHAALQELSFDPALARLFASTSWPAVERQAAWVAEADPYGERGALEQALEKVSASADLTRDHIVHKHWCAWRQAAWTSGLAEPLEVLASGLERLEETAGHPTVLLAPMTVAAPDALHAITSLAPPDRPCIVFGEDMGDGEAYPDERPDIATGAATESVPRIREALDAEGFFCTYADFVYDGRRAQSFELFGSPRPVSTGFLSLAARDDTMLMPVVVLYRDGGLAVSIEEPIQISLGPDLAQDPAAARTLVAPVVARCLEALIRRAPEQWLLLPTLTFASPEMAAIEPAPS